MIDDARAAVGGPIARLRAARRAAALFSSAESPRAKAITLVGLVALTFAIFALTTAAGVNVAPTAALVVPVVLGGVLLERPALRILLLVVTVALIGELLDQGWNVVRPGSVVLLVVLGAIAVELARDRERLGLSVGRGESILLELRDQLRRQGDLPALPRGWHADVALRSAGGTAFGGDFIVSTLSDDGKRLELAVVDVSGKGLDAGTRALMLSGALGGLLGAIAPERFLTAANDYLLRMEAEESFATAVHVAIDLSTGHYRLTSAGHPPGAHYSGGSGRWQLVELEGLVLGLVPGAIFGVAEGQLGPYDALLLYTDGLIEAPGRDLAVGIDRLLGGAESLVPHGFTDGAAAIVEEVAPAAADDRAVVLLWRGQSA
ncbi:MAG TPA: PP2C family protein-serine/threonine phosphatase [Mycobacteriales bacterium]|nr:PP2C family protein-serine/threonine phosphatase [Mycobacteriales bacterium]